MKTKKNQTTYIAKRDLREEIYGTLFGPNKGEEITYDRINDKLGLVIEHYFGYGAHQVYKWEDVEAVKES